MSKIYTTTDKVKKFTGNMAWYYLSVKETYADYGVPKPKWGLIPIRATCGDTTWTTSLLPFGDGTLFIALKAAVRKSEDIAEGKRITVSYRLGK